MIIEWVAGLYASSLMVLYRSQRNSLPFQSSTLDLSMSLRARWDGTFEVMRRISKAVSQAVARDSFPLVLSGNCNASAAVAADLTSTVPDLNFWCIDAHDDLDTPRIHENGYLDAMAASMMGGLSWETLMKLSLIHI